MNPGAFTHWLDEDSGDMFQQAMACWAQHWDWDRPTLFGIDQAGLDAVLAAWFVVAAESEIAAVLDKPGPQPAPWWVACAPPVDDGVALTGRLLTDDEELAAEILWLV